MAGLVDRLRRGIAGSAMLVLALALLGCSPPEPLRIGFVGGISGRVADLGIAGRNGTTLAVEQRNRAGGIDGRPIELLVEDDRQDPAVAEQAVARLIERRVEVIVGPMTSAMAVAVVPTANRAGITMVSPTVTTRALAGIDDQFLRVLAATDEYARTGAAYHYAKQGRRRVAAVFDRGNAAYGESWLADYRRAFEAAGGRVVAVQSFASSDQTRFAELAAGLLEAAPDCVLVIANSVDTALLAQQIRRLDPNVGIATSEWAATERLIELGGKAVEGIVVAQFIDRGSRQPAYLAFRAAYLERFGGEPGFAGLAAFDATNVVLDALAIHQPGQSLKQTILRRGEFPGAQSPIRFDASGDAFRPTWLTTVRDGAFVRLP